MLTPSMGFCCTPLTETGSGSPAASRIVGATSITWWNWERISPFAFMPLGKITGLDPALEMHRLASKRIAQAGLDVDLVGLSAEHIPLDDASFDCVVVTYTLCSVPDPVTALKEMRRVLKTDGSFSASTAARRTKACVAGKIG